jgi:hypothetical protein
MNELPQDSFGLGVQERVTEILLRYPAGPSVDDLGPVRAG